MNDFLATKPVQHISKALCSNGSFAAWARWYHENYLWVCIINDIALWLHSFEHEVFCHSTAIAVSMFVVWFHKVISEFSGCGSSCRTMVLLSTVAFLSLPWLLPILFLVLVFALALVVVVRALLAIIVLVPSIAIQIIWEVLPVMFSIMLATGIFDVAVLGGLV